MKKNILVNGIERKFLIIDLNNNYFFFIFKFNYIYINKD